jgi:di/tricarboxylate transporter
MTFEQGALFAIMGGVLALLLWGRWRYDLVAFGALVLAVLIGVVDKSMAFSGFGHPAVIVIALVLIVSRGLAQSGAIEILTRRLIRPERSLHAHIAIMGGIGAFLSAFMNNVAALALLMPVDIQAARRARRSPALTLMPLSFATILGGMTTMIGTPPNIVVAQFREDALGAAYGMFDFTPVGLLVAAAGIAFVALLGWRFLRPRDGAGAARSQESHEYVMEVLVPEGSPAIGKTFREVKEIAEESDVWLVALVRRGRREKRPADAEIRKGDVLVIEGAPEGLEQLAGVLKLDLSRSRKHGALLADTVTLMEAVVPREARIVNRSAEDLRLLARHGVILVGISRHGQKVRGRVRKERIRAGDLLLLLGPENVLEETIRWMGALPLERGREGVTVPQRQKAALAVGIFAVAIVAASVGLVYLPVALAAVVVAYVLLRIVSLSQVYDSVEWPVIVLLAALIPIGAALESSGGTALIARGILWAAEGLSPVLVLVIIMVVTMTLSDVLNNVATVLVAGPVAVQVARALEVNPDTLLMGVAVAASCAFLTPIGHKNNTIIMGPGGYAFGDYWRMGLPLEAVVLMVSVPAILYFWPLAG